MINFKLRYCKTHMAAFLDGTLPHRTRQRVGRLIDQRPECYAEYVRARAIKRDLTDDLPAFGQPNPAQLQRIWDGIRTSMQPVPPRGGYGTPRLRVSYGAACIVLMLMLLPPLWMAGPNAARASITLPAPVVHHVTATDTPDVRVAVVAAATPTHTHVVNVTRLQPEAAPQRTPDASPGN